MSILDSAVSYLTGGNGGGGNLGFSVVSESSGQGVWTRARLIECTPMVASENTDYPFDFQGSADNTSQVDLPAAKIIMPSHYRCVFLVPDLSTVESIIAAWEDTTATFKLNSRGIISSNMVLTTVEITHDASVVSATKVTMDFEQAVVPELSGYNPENAADNGTYGLGVQAPVQQSTLTNSSIFNNLLLTGGI